MNAVAIDTLKFANRLKAAGFNDEQAEAITCLQQELVTLTLVQMREAYNADDWVVRRDLDEHTAILQHGTKELEVAQKVTETNLKRDINEMEVAMKAMETGLKRDIKEMEVAMKAMETGLKRDMKEIETGLKRDMKEMETALKHDMKAMETKLQTDIALLRTEVQRDIAAAKTDLTRWMIGVGLLQTSIITGVLLKVAHLI